METPADLVGYALIWIFRGEKGTKTSTVQIENGQFLAKVAKYMANPKVTRISVSNYVSAPKPTDRWTWSR